MRIYIIRHGETDANKSGVLQGCLDYALNDEGIRLAKITGEALKGIKFDEAFTSPLRRAMDTCKLVLSCSENINTPVISDDRIKEINMGDWEGKAYGVENKEIEGEGVKYFFKGDFRFNGCPNGETLGELMERTQDFLKELISRNDDKTYLISTHGCALRAMLNFLYENKEDFWQHQIPYNCCVNILDAKDGIITFVEKDKVYYEKKDCIDRYGKEW